MAAPQEHDQDLPGAVAHGALQRGHPGPGLDPEGPYPPCDRHPVAVLHLAYGHSPRRELEAGRKGGQLVLRCAAGGPAGPARQGGRRPPPQVVGDEGHVGVREVGQGPGDGARGAVVQEAVPHPGVLDPGQEHAHLGLAVAQGVAHQLHRGPGDAPVGAVDDVEGHP